MDERSPVGRIDGYPMYRCVGRFWLRQDRAARARSTELDRSTRRDLFFVGAERLWQEHVASRDGGIDRAHGGTGND